MLLAEELLLDAYSPAGDPRKILIVDEPEQVQAVSKHLSPLNIEVEAAYNCREVLISMEQSVIHLVLLGADLPNHYGYELCRSIRTKYAIELLPIIMLTRLRRQEAIEDGFRAGASDYLITPFTPRELVARIEARLALRLLQIERTKQTLTKTERSILRLYYQYPHENRRTILQRINEYQQHIITEKTLATHITNILKKIGMKNVKEASIKAHRNGWI